VGQRQGGSEGMNYEKILMALIMLGAVAAFVLLAGLAA
jgi:hypothetical protein